jgi:hypothetical protein
MLFPKPTRRKLARPWRAQRDDPVTPDLREFILARDRVCTAVVVGYAHECRDEFGYPHDYRDTRKLSIEHVFVGGRGFGLRRPPSDREHLVALCHGLNRRHLPADVNRKLVDYLVAVNALDERRRRIGSADNRGRESFGTR